MSGGEAARRIIAGRRFSWRRLLKSGRAEVRRSLQARTVALVVAVTLAVAVVFSVLSMISVRSTLHDQVSMQARNDFSTMVQQAQNGLDSSDVTDSVQYQQLVNDLASSLQNEGASNLTSVYLWGKDDESRFIVPVSTDPTYESLITDDMRAAVDSDTHNRVFYQPVSLDVAGRTGVPGAVLGTTLEFGAAGGLELYALFSYESQDRSLAQIQMNLIAICLALSMMVGVVVWMTLHGIIRPVGAVAAAAETFAAGDLDARVPVTRKDEIGSLQDSFNKMADALNQKIDELEEAGAMQRRFVSDVSHELRTPVTTMRMASDLLESRKDDYDPMTRRTVELLSGQINRFQDMLADLLEISRYDAGYAALDLVESDIRETIDEAVDQVDGLAKAKGVPIRTYLPNIGVLAYFDTRRIVRIIRNLLANAIDFAEDGPIEIRLAANRKAFVISVRDYGVGMSRDQVPHVFDRFWRGDPSRARTTGGTGLGLSIAMTDAKLHQGTIRVRSEEGEGTWFLVMLPRDPSLGAVPDNEMPVDFERGTRALRITGGFGIADNRSADYVKRATDGAVESAADPVADPATTRTDPTEGGDE
ncbi:MtrAB system histidine kinase MtrB [Bifidobacterium stellenboschense]|uniref:Sensor histidine kinase MtrB n=1 Tax=Bifidobacterium stellenboschense TaxID=762211 RepID=A0A087DQU6_9BIFI|nr:MtrAB system histidine kinase MtrB [Bifidobacterium stellenboschense]KFI97896.1 signal transduction histidine kinase [Bifidobacterium stellenboschense]